MLQNSTDSPDRPSLKGYGRDLRKLFTARISTDFDYLLAEIDRAHRSRADAHDTATARQSRPAPPAWLVAPFLRSGTF